MWRTNCQFTLTFLSGSHMPISCMGTLLIFDSLAIKLSTWYHFVVRVVHFAKLEGHFVDFWPCAIKHAKSWKKGCPSGRRSCPDLDIARTKIVQVLRQAGLSSHATPDTVGASTIGGDPYISSLNDKHGAALDSVTDRKAAASRTGACKNRSGTGQDCGNTEETGNW